MRRPLWRRVPFVATGDSAAAPAPDRCPLTYLREAYKAKKVACDARLTRAAMCRTAYPPLQTIYGFAEPAATVAAVAAATAASATATARDGELRRILTAAAERTASWLLPKNETGI